MLVKMNALAESERPTSADPDFWNVWSGLEELQDGNPRQVSRPVDWNLISRDWQERSESDKK
ncbi:hypothetical protein [Marinospirillum insulare]|uniref:Uncharacterized protein n=1 Tax=Marinospirillum insulare TaxID=217169 RepID=A0ABQ5ZY10_9GAMM|nr:hypothetical protein [Marinospirillum insulare]GLR62774.1 hypothetical protein GCM10007878_02090 [Marinospirillum insulare]